MAMSIAPSFAPPRALRIWHVRDEIFVEIPGHGDKPPYITSYPYNTRGIALTLSLLGANRIDYDHAGPQALPSAYRTNIATTGPGTAEQQASADLALRRAGLLK